VGCLGLSVFDYQIFAEWISFFVCGMLLRGRGPRILWKISLALVSLYITTILRKIVTLWSKNFFFYTPTKKAKR